MRITLIMAIAGGAWAQSLSELVEEGLTHYERREWTSAADKFEAALKLRQSSSKIHHLLGKVLAEKSVPPDPGRIIEVFSALSERQHSAESRYWLGRAYLMQEEQQDAKDWLRRAKQTSTKEYVSEKDIDAALLQATEPYKPGVLQPPVPPPKPPGLSVFAPAILGGVLVMTGAVAVWVMRRRQPKDPRVFISYRKDDTRLSAVMLYNDLVKEFGKGDVFLDSELLGAGSWRRQIPSALARCRVVLVVIGRQWLAILKKRQSDPKKAKDVHREEIALALSLNDITVMPVQVDNTEVIDGRELPDDIRALTDQQSFELADSGARREADLQKLIHEIRTALERPRTRQAA